MFGVHKKAWLYLLTVHVRLRAPHHRSVKGISAAPANHLSCFYLQICCLKGQRGRLSQPTFDGIHIVNHYTGVEDAYRSSDDDGMEAPQSRSCTRIRLHPNLGDTDSEEDGETLRLTVPQNNNNNHKSTTVWSAPAWPERGGSRKNKKHSSGFQEGRALYHVNPQFGSLYFHRLGKDGFWQKPHRTNQRKRKGWAPPSQKNPQALLLVQHREICAIKLFYTLHPMGFYIFKAFYKWVSDM